MRRFVLIASATVVVCLVIFLLPLKKQPPPAVAEIAVLTAENFDRLAPHGKEADAIIGDYLLRNDRLVAVVGNPVPRRDANASVQGVGGAVIDLTLRDRQEDLLTAFYPGGGYFLCNAPQMTAQGGVPASVPRGEPGTLQAMQVTLTCLSPQRANRPEVRLAYTLKQGEPFLTVTSDLANLGDQPLEVPVEDLVRADGPSFEKVPAGEAELAWFYDAWFGQAYGLAAEGHGARIVQEGEATIVRWLTSGREGLTMRPGEHVTLTRRLFPAADSIGVKAIQQGLLGRPVRSVSVRAVDANDRPVASADVAFLQDGSVYGRARTASDGTVDLDLPSSAGRLEVSALGKGQRAIDMTEEPSRASSRDRRVLLFALEAGTRLVGRITGESGQPIPCKVMLQGIEGTPTPDFGPEDGAEQIKNLIYTPDGRFSRVLPPGTYTVTASHGPEHDAVTRRLEVPANAGDIAFEATLKRSVDTRGWISADFHGHTTASGDTAASVRGRVLNLAAEQIEFAPCTEHNRIDTYEPEIEALGLTRALRTCTGLEMTREPFPVGHQNAFPLVMKPHTQSNGAPAPDRDLARQVRRLAEWDGSSEKLVQQNHPDIGWMFFDSNEDGQPDAGFAGVFPYLEAIEVYGTNVLKMEPFVYKRSPSKPGEPPSWTRENNRIFNWLQLLNQGVRLPGVANTDAHTNYHGSGGVRNYVKCSTDDPGSIDPLEIVRNTERGHVVMTNGPFLEVSLRPAGDATGEAAMPGDEIAVPSGRATLRVRVQCPNWFDIDRVQVLVNGRARDDLGFTRYKHPKKFSQGVVKFDHELELVLSADAHVIVVAADKHKSLDPIMGPFWGDSPPVAISNPIFVDVDGGGFRADGDTLGYPLPVKGGEAVAEPPAAYRTPDR